MLLNRLLESLPDINFQENVSLAQFCSLGAGGYAEIFSAPCFIEDMKRLFAWAVKENIPVYVLGGGTNILFPDGLIKGIVISTHNLKSLDWRTNLTADIDAGVKLSSIMKELREHNLGGFEFAAGIPGTLGGAISGNAGAGGHGVCELIDFVVTIEKDGSIKTWTDNEFVYGYRKCSLADEKRIIVSSRLTFRKATSKDKDVLESYLLRRGSQPHGLRNAGCTFKNPEGYSAGKLLDECGCKGLSIGEAVVSDLHANFILNKGNASSSDIMQLIDLCAEKVYSKTGIRLEKEIKIIDTENKFM